MGQRIYITCSEHARLIRKSGEVRKPIATAFGPGGVWLATENEKIVSTWALPLLAEWRGLTMNEGAGI